MLLLPILAAAPAAIVVQDVPRPYRPPQRELLACTIGDATCGRAAVEVTRPVEPFIAQAYLYPAEAIAPLTMTFTIDATGRPMDIARTDQHYAPEASDVAPSLAASGFEPGTPRRDCRVTYTLKRMTPDSASLADLRRYSIAPNVAPDREVFRRTYPAGSDCFSPVPEPRLRGFPPFRDLPPIVGRIAWSMTAFDIDARGRPVRLLTVDGTGDAALDRASRKAVAESRFDHQARHGCVYPYYQSPAILPEPAPPETASLRPADATCPTGDGRWATQPALVFPAAWNRRKIEGWAVIAYDVAPWGETGNVRVLAAEPAAEFGAAASSIIRAATRPKSSTGYTGCVERVRYRIERPGDRAESAVNVDPSPTLR